MTDSPDARSPKPSSAPHQTFLSDVVKGLSDSPKRIPSKYFYDQRGSELFDEICNLAEYYPTRTELGILRGYASEIAAAIGPHARLIELGSGSSVKTRVVLDALVSHALAEYVPVDISLEHLSGTAESLRQSYPAVTISPLHADYTEDFDPGPRPPSAKRDVIYFPGSTIGNLDPAEARAFLERLRPIAGSEGALIIGVDLKKDPQVLHAAYNDSRGTTAQFNLNVIRRMRDELNVDVDPSNYFHYAFYEPVHGRIEMHLVSKQTHALRVEGHTFELREGESILTEYSYKYDLQGFADLASAAGFRVEKAWLDAAKLFSVQHLVPVAVE